MPTKVLVQARVDKDVKGNSTENGNWLFDEREKKFLKKEIVKEIEKNQDSNFANRDKESMRNFLKRAMKAVGS